jgi:3-methyladenine DNA glycosylase AlkD
MKVKEKLSFEQVMAELEAAGSEQTRKTYRRHGVIDEQFGVNYSFMNPFAKKIKVDHELAKALWASGNHDARILATMIADPEQADDALLETWIHDLNNYGLSDAFSGYAAKTPLAREKAEQWTQSDHEWIGATGWNVLGDLARNDASLPDEYFLPYLDTIERDLHSAKNRTRYSMNNALIAIGLRPGLEARAIDVAHNIGKVIVDHGETNCKTPDAISYIQKVRDRQSKN